MKLWLIERDDGDCRYDQTYAAVVAAESEDEARRLSPVDCLRDDGGPPAGLVIKYIGEAADGIPTGDILTASLAG